MGAAARRAVWVVAGALLLAVAFLTGASLRATFSPGTSVGNLQPIDDNHPSTAPPWLHTQGVQR